MSSPVLQSQKNPVENLKPSLWESLQNIPQARLAWLWLLIGFLLLPFTAWQIVIPLAAWLVFLTILAFTRRKQAVSQPEDDK